MASPEPALQTSLLPIFITRLQSLKAIAPGLRDVPRARLDELLSLLERAEKLIEESMGRLISAEAGAEPQSL